VTANDDGCECDYCVHQGEFSCRRTLADAALKASGGEPPATQQAQGEICTWAKTEYEWGEGYGTGCGERVQSLIDIEGMRFCPYCGRKLSPVR
jgi:hypothetical protein